MRVSKKAKQSAAYTNQDEKRYRPLNAEYYPKYFEDEKYIYRSLYYAEKIIGYEKYNQRNYIVGFIVAYEINGVQDQWIVENLPFQSMWYKFESFIDKNYNNRFYDTICQLTSDY